ncbi:hypothetical protein DB347_17795 [Opitutaceae bacterium EW11]|nr:hypothetical protein DB347_17795 [Opitutaceae bacterium EW11]
MPLETVRKLLIRTSHTPHHGANEAKNGSFRLIPEHLLAFAPEFPHVLLQSFVVEVHQVELRDGGISDVLPDCQRNSNGDLAWCRFEFAAAQLKPDCVTIEALFKQMEVFAGAKR